MRISFDYKGVTPKDIENVIKLFYEEYKNELGTDGEVVEIGKVNVYIALNNKTDNSTLLTTDKDGDITSWTVKNRIMKNTNKELFTKFTDTENPDDITAVYIGKERKNKTWGY